jgi:N utilization substance protein A
MEVPEIYEGIVEIKEAVRDPSGRAKIAVMSNDKDVDPVGACVGMKGMRVQAVVQELRGEKIDIIQWTNDQEQFVRNALSPAKVTRVYVDNTERAMQVIVPDDQLSLAIGKRGQNVRLAAKLTHWKIDIKSESETDSDVGRQEALRRAEMAFHSPHRTSTETAEASGPDADAPSSKTLPASGALLAADTNRDSTADSDETAGLLSPLGSEEGVISSELCGDTLAEDTDASTAQRTVISDDTKEKAC